VLLLGFWFLTALNTNPLAPAPTAGRYSTGIVLMGLVAGGAVRGMEFGRWADRCSVVAVAARWPS